jgi:hypothetical protein
MDPLTRLKLAAHRLAVVEEDGILVVYQIRRVEPLELLRDGIPAIPGIPEVVDAGKASAADLDRQLRLQDATPEQRQLVEDELAKQREAAVERTLAAILKSPQAIGAFFGTCDSYLRHGVDAVGVARPGVDEGLVDPELGPADVCEPFELEPGGPTLYVRPVRLVDEITGDDQLALRDLPLKVRGKLAALIATAFGGGGKAARTFRGQPGDRGAAGHVGPSVRPEAERVPDPVAGGGRGRAKRAARRKGG